MDNFRECMSRNIIISPIVGFLYALSIVVDFRLGFHFYSYRKGIFFELVPLLLLTMIISLFNGNDGTEKLVNFFIVSIISFLFALVFLLPLIPLMFLTY